MVNLQNCTVLVIEDEELMRQMVTSFLDREGLHADAANDAEKAFDLIGSRQYDVVLVDLHLPSVSGMEVIRHIKSVSPDTEIIVFTGQPSLDTAIDAVHQNVFDYLCKPVELSVLLRRIGQAAERRYLVLQNRELIRQLEKERNGLRDEVIATKQAIEKHLSDSPDFIGESAAINRVRRLIAEVAPSDMSVLIRGESGTGKDVVARLIHEWSGRSPKGKYVKVNCPAISENLIESEMFGHEKGSFTGAVKRKPGRFEFAAGGTVFLDEIGSIPPFVQAKLLQVIEHKQFVRLGGHETISVDVRIISATNADLETLIQQHAFRPDLYYRLEQFTIVLPPLRDRREDIPLLVKHFLVQHCMKYAKPTIHIPSATMARLAAYSWPGNVRQLKAVIERFALNEDVDELEAAVSEPKKDPASARNSSGMLEENEIQAIVTALTEANWNRRKAARRLGISYSTLRRKIDKHNITPLPFYR